MYKITDTIEVGYAGVNSKGATVEITFEFLDYDTSLRSKSKKLIDNLDHSLITDNLKMIELSERYFLLNELTNIFNDINIILHYLIQQSKLNVLQTFIKINDEEVCAIDYSNNSVIKMNTT